MIRAHAWMFALLLTAMPAQGGCRFNTGNAIVCIDPQSAAMAFTNFGFDSQRTNLSYNRAILRQAGCGRAYGTSFKTAEIKQINRGRVALPSGWVGVTTVEVNGHESWYVATGYLSGTCDIYRPHEVTGAADYSLPDFAR